MASKSPTGTTKASIPKAFKQPVKDFRDLATGASEQIKQVGPYGGPFAAAMDPREKEAIDMLAQIARTRGGEGQPVMDLARRMLGPGYTDVSNDSVIRAMVNAAVAPQRDVMDQALNRIRAVSSGSGADLGARALIAENQANLSGMRGIGETSAGIYGNELARREALQAQVAPQMFALGQQLQEGPARLLGEAGTTARGLEQATVVNPALQAYNERIAATMRPMQPFQQFFGATGLPFNQQSTQSGGGGIGGALQGGLAGASAGAPLGPWGALAGGVGGALLGGFG